MQVNESNLMVDLKEQPIQKRAILQNIQNTSHLQEEIGVVERQARWWKQKALLLETHVFLDSRRLPKVLANRSNPETFSEASRALQTLLPNLLSASAGCFDGLRTKWITGSSFLKKI